MDASLSPDQKNLWEALLCVARVARSRKTVDYRAARDALEIEEMATRRLAAATPGVAAPATTGGTSNER